jgi:small subunit ribosomal protein S6
MNNYEGLFIIKPELKEEDTKNVIKSISDAITKGGGAIKKEENWGRKQLAYPVNKSKDGYCYKIDFDLDPAQVIKIEATYKLNTDILRTMITRK